MKMKKWTTKKKIDKTLKEINKRRDKGEDGQGPRKKETRGHDMHFLEESGRAHHLYNDGRNKDKIMNKEEWAKK